MADDHGGSAAGSGSPFLYTVIPYFVDENGAKRPSLARGFTFEGLPYGSVTQPAPGMPHHGWGFTGSITSGLVPVDIDNPAGFGATRLGELLGPVIDVLRGSVKAKAGGRRHIHLDGRKAAAGGWWPGQWATAEWPYDIKTNGFVRGEPDYLPHPGPLIEWTPEMTAAAAADKAEHRVLFPPPGGGGQGTASGAHSGWSPGMPGSLITGDNELSAAVMKMARAGFSHDRAYGEWLRVQCPVEAEWTDADFERHWSGNVEDAYRETVRAADADAALARELHWPGWSAAPPEELAWTGGSWVRRKDLEAAETRAIYTGAGLPRGVIAAPGVFAGGDAGRGAPPTPYQQMAGDGPFSPDSWDETQISEEILIRAHGTLACAPGIGGWIADRGTVWETTDPGGYVAALGQLCPPVYADDTASDQEKAAARKRNDARHRLRSNAGNSSLSRQMALVAGANGALTSISDLDADNETLWAGGRLWNLRTLEEMDGRGIPHLKNAPFAPDFSGKTPYFTALLGHIFPDEETRLWAMRVFGHIVHGRTDKQAGIIELRGEANTAKSTMARCLSFALGTGAGYATDIEDDLFDGTLETARAFGQIPGSRLVYLDEWSDRKGKISRTRLKKLTGGQRFQARLLYCDPSDFEPHHTFMVSLNPDVALPYDDPAVRARVVSLPFLGDPQAVAPAVAAALAALPAEAPAILGMLMRSGSEILADPLRGTMGDAPDAAAREFMNAVGQADDIMDWLNDVMAVGARTGERTEETDIRDLLSLFNAWAGSAQRPQVKNTRSLGRRLGRLIGTELHRESDGRSMWQVSRRGYEPASR